MAVIANIPLPTLGLAEITKHNMYKIKVPKLDPNGNACGSTLAV